MTSPNTKHIMEKFERDAAATLYPALDLEDQQFLRALTARCRLTQQELRILAESARDLRMWRETPLPMWWQQAEQALPPANDARLNKKQFLQRLHEHLATLRRIPKSYPPEGLRPPPRPVNRETVDASGKTLMGLCPVASEDTVCCQLRTVDAVENCGFSCSYCTIQTFYGDDVRFDERLAEKLSRLDLAPDHVYHVGTGQASDALFWGNRYGVLEDLLGFAAEHPNVLLELKTKSDNVGYLLEHPVPSNVICSWTLNTETVIRNEEHFTASLDARLGAARAVADRGIPVAFHLHPLVLYNHWEDHYCSLAARLLRDFAAEEVMFVSLGAVTFIKPVVDAIRRRGGETKMLQMELIPGVKGKLSYPEDTKAMMFSTVYRALALWHWRVFIYLCMEPPHLWHRSFGYCYGGNARFEEDFGRTVMARLPARGTDTTP